MTPEEIEKVKHMLWEISSERTIDQDRIRQVVKIVRRLLNAYQGTVRKMYRLRERLRGEQDERDGH
jgi:hypothetical protein